MYKEEGEREEYRIRHHETGKEGIMQKAALIVPQIVGQHVFKPLTKKIDNLNAN
jgi:hypothetical protein